MRRGSTQDVLRHLRTLYCCGVIGQQSDEQLLEQFIALHDDTAEEAFAALVQRHGPMVFGVCRRTLGDAHEAEDAFQATFLVLARKARSVIRREKVASWLYGVAYRTARELRVRTGRRRAREERVSRPSLVESVDGLDQTSCGRSSTRSWRGCPRATAARSSSASSRACRARRPLAGSAFPKAPFPAGWRGPRPGCGLGWKSAGWPFPPRRFRSTLFEKPMQLLCPTRSSRRPLRPQCGSRPVFPRPRSFRPRLHH